MCPPAIERARVPINRLAKALARMQKEPLGTQGRRDVFAIRPAKVEDAEEACALIRRSITELCREDHENDPMALEGWLANKTPKNVATWFTALGVYSWVAVEGDRIVGVATLSGGGEIMLLYVLPEARFQGVSKALLAQAEAKARELKREILALTTTLTAKPFYLAHGYELMPDEDADDGLGFDGVVALTKRLTSE
jgi:GNAT superfamily N-acetyltransferase